MLLSWGKGTAFPNNSELTPFKLCCQDLLRNKSRLEHDLRIKGNSLAIDKQKCLSNRRSFPYQVLTNI
jgi:hypothetical protein